VDQFRLAGKPTPHCHEPSPYPARFAHSISKAVITVIDKEHAMKRISTLAICAAAVLSVAGIAHADDHRDDCSARTLHGTYVFAANGFAISGGAAQPKTIVEIIEFNGDGTLSVPAATRSVNGIIARSLPSVGTYTVDESCTGTIAFDGPTFDVFIAPNGRELWLIQTNPPSVFEGSAKRVAREHGGPH
jgi:hypothetical protein